MAEQENIFAAVVGTGFIGPVHVEAVRRLGRPMIGVAGSSPEKAREAAARLNVTRAYDSFEDLLADPMVTVVHIATPNYLHFEQCRQALAADKHVLCEKPLALTSAQSAELVQLSSLRSRLAAGVCYNIRYYPLCLEIKHRLAEGLLGPIYHITGSYTQDWLLFDTDYNWRVEADKAGPLRAVADIGTHWMDLITFVTGLQIESVCADLQTFLPTRQRPPAGVETFAGKQQTPALTEPISVTTEDYGSVLLHFQGGARGEFTVSQVNAGRKNRLTFEIAGARGALAWDSERPEELWFGQRDRANQLLLRDPALMHESARAFTNYPGGHAEGYPDTFKQLFRSFYDYIARGDHRASRPFPTFADGHREVLLCEAILKSHQERRWVNL